MGASLRPEATSIRATVAMRGRTRRRRPELHRRRRGARALHPGAL